MGLAFVKEHILPHNSDCILVSVTAAINSSIMLIALLQCIKFKNRS